MPVRSGRTSVYAGYVERQYVTCYRGVVLNSGTGHRTDTAHAAHAVDEDGFLIYQNLARRVIVSNAETTHRPTGAGTRPFLPITITDGESRNPLQHVVSNSFMSVVLRSIYIESGWEGILAQSSVPHQHRCSTYKIRPTYWLFIYSFTKGLLLNNQNLAAADPSAIAVSRIFYCCRKSAEKLGWRKIRLSAETLNKISFVHDNYWIIA